ncbi:MAG: DNA polymerase IV [Bacteroidetes bacterium]|nr:DNA polymerase IV [Bacteroidota bacterium]
MTHTPYILHMDLDAFFASVEVLKNPALRGKPVIVGGTGRRGVVTSCSYEARVYGVHSAMPGHQARKLCPQAIFLKGDGAAYGHFSRLIQHKVRAAVPFFRAASIDEFYCDLTGMERFHDPWPFAQKLRREIIAETGLPISMGLASSKTVAKIATGMAKPNGELWVPPGTEARWLAPLPVGEIPGAGKRTIAALVHMGIHTIGDLQQHPLPVLEKRLGKMGYVLWHKAQGYPGSLVTTERVRKSLGHERTFMEDIADKKRLTAVLTRLVEKCGHELRTQGLWCSCVTLKFRYADFTYQTHQQHIALTRSDEVILQTAKSLLAHRFSGRKPLRLLGVRLSDLQDTPGQQSLFEDAMHQEQLHRAMDAIKLKYGEKSLKRASGLESGY